MDEEAKNRIDQMLKDKTIEIYHRTWEKTANKLIKTEKIGLEIINEETEGLKNTERENQ